MHRPEDPTELPLRGRPLHTRHLLLDLLAGGPLDLVVRGEILDLRKNGFVPSAGDLQTAGIIHHMTLEASVDAATRTLRALETAQPHVAFEPSEATGGECCRDPAPRLQALVGERFDVAFAKQLGAVFGGALGCSHLLTLFQLLAATLPPALDLEDAVEAARAPGERIAKRAVFLDGHRAAQDRLEIAVQLSDFHTVPRARTKQPLDRLALQHEVRVHAVVDFEALGFVALDVFERRRTREELASARWVSRGEAFASLVGQSALRGTAGRIFAIAGADPDLTLPRDALLQVAPGLIQCLAAMSDAMLEHIAGPEPSGELPKNLGVGGFPDSCFMWRADSALTRSRQDAGRG